MNDGGEPVAGVLLHVLPDVEHRPARGVDQRASLALVSLKLPDGHTEGGQDDDCFRPEPVGVRIRITQEPNTRRAQFLVHVRIVNDLAGQVHGPVRELQPGLVRVVNGAVDPVAKSELTREPDGQSSGAIRVV